MAKRGRPKHEPTPELRAKVEAWASVLISHERIARLVGISENTLRRHYKAELETGDIQAEVGVKSALFHAVTKQEGWAVLFLCKARYGMSEKQRVPVEGIPDTQPNEELEAEFRKIVDAEVEARLRTHAARTDGDGGDAQAGHDADATASGGGGASTTV